MTNQLSDNYKHFERIQSEGFEQDEDLKVVEKEFNSTYDKENSLPTSSTQKSEGPQTNYKTANPVLKKIKTRRIDWLHDELPQKIDLSDPEFDVNVGVQPNYRIDY